MGTDFEEKIKIKISEGESEYLGSDEKTLGYIKMFAIKTDNDVALAKEVRRVLGVEKSRRYSEDINGHIYHYLPADNKL
jgi:hypothetical protein